MKNKYLLTSAFLMAGVLFLAKDSAAQRLVSGGKPRPAEIDFYRDTYCVNLSNNYRVCKGRSTEDESEAHFIFQKNKKTLGKSGAPFSAFSETPDFWAFRGDFDKDGSQEIVIASQVDITNGMGIAKFDIHIFRDPLKFGVQKPFTFPVEDFGEKGNFIYDPRRNETQILVTYWSGFDNLDKRRGYGTYLVGKWFRYLNGLLQPVLEKPTLARRRLYGFGKEVDKKDLSLTPYLWLKSKNTHRFFAEPKESAKLISEQTGNIKNYRMEENDEFKRYFSVQMDSGEIVEGLLSYSVYGYYGEEKRLPITDLGLWKNKFVFPFWLNPELIMKNLTGKKVKLEIYQDASDNRYARLWILEN